MQRIFFREWYLPVHMIFGSSYERASCIEGCIHQVYVFIILSKRSIFVLPSSSSSSSSNYFCTFSLKTVFDIHNINCEQQNIISFAVGGRRAASRRQAGRLYSTSHTAALPSWLHQCFCLTYFSCIAPRSRKKTHHLSSLDIEVHH